MSNKITTDLLEFIENSPSCFHAVQTTKEILTKHGFTELSEDQTWNLTPGIIPIKSRSAKAARLR